MTQFDFLTYCFNSYNNVHTAVYIVDVLVFTLVPSHIYQIIILEK